MLPTDRLQRAGATPEEITHLQSEHASEPHSELVARFERIADHDIHQWLQELRAAGHFLQEQVVEHVEPKAKVERAKGSDDNAQPET